MAGRRASPTQRRREPVGTPSVKLDRKRRQFTVKVAHSDWDPGASTVRLSAGVGLWDVEQGRYLVPGASATETTPGGAGGLSRPAAIFNAAFRFQEPFQGPDFTVLTDATWWRDRVQGRALRDGDLGRFHAEVDFGKLLAGVDDDMPGQPGGVPQDGPMNRILASRFETAQGIDFSTVCLGGTLPQSCKGEFRGQLQPYAIYVPRKPVAGRRLRADAPAPLARRHVQPVLDLAQPVAVRRTRRGVDRDHAAGARAGRLLLRPCRRRTCSRCGPTSRAATPLDPDWTVIAGYSMGGYGAYKLASQFPDLFARVQTTVGPPGISSADTRPLLPSLRNVPVLIWAGARRRAGPDRRRARRGAAPRRPRIPLHVLGVRRHDPHPARVQRPVRARGGVPRLGAGGPRPAARHLCVQPGHGLRGRRDGRGARVLGLGREAARRCCKQRSGCRGRALGGVRPRRPGRIADQRRRAGS